jgi:hypothetical protein
VAGQSTVDGILNDDNKRDFYSFQLGSQADFQLEFGNVTTSARFKLYSVAEDGTKFLLGRSKQADESSPAQLSVENLTVGDYLVKVQRIGTEEVAYTLNVATDRGATH